MVPGKRSRRGWWRRPTSKPTTAPAPRPCVFRAAKPEPALRRPRSDKGAADLAPVLKRMLLAGHDLHRDLVITGGEKGGDPLFDLVLGACDRRLANEFGGHKPPLLGFDEHQVAAVVFEVRRPLRPEPARQLDIEGDRFGNRRRGRSGVWQAHQRLVGGAV